jgi:hypothetical protein
LTVKKGVPPTERKARTGELTPPGIIVWARAKRSSETVGMDEEVLAPTLCLDKQQRGDSDLEGNPGDGRLL